MNGPDGIEQRTAFYEERFAESFDDEDFDDTWDDELLDIAEASIGRISAESAL